MIPVGIDFNKRWAYGGALTPTALRAVEDKCHEMKGDAAEEGGQDAREAATRDAKYSAMGFYLCLSLSLSLSLTRTPGLHFLTDK